MSMVIWSLCFISLQFFQILYKLKISTHCPQFGIVEHLADNNLEETNITHKSVYYMLKPMILIFLHRWSGVFSFFKLEPYLVHLSRMNSPAKNWMSCELLAFEAHQQKGRLASNWLDPLLKKSFSYFTKVYVKATKPPQKY